MRSYNSGIEALAAGDFRIRLAPAEKEVYGLIKGQEVLLIWDTRSDNPQWKKEAVEAYKNRR